MRDEDNPKKYQFSEEVNFYVDLLADDFCEVDDQGHLQIRSPL